MMHQIREFFSGLFARPELETLNPWQVEEIARDTGVTADELYRLDRSGVHDTLMQERLAQEGVSPTVIQAEWPSVWKDLQRVCTLCDSRDVCRHELELTPDASDWQRYCPNEGTIKSLPHTKR